VAGITLKTIFFDSLAEWVGLTFYLTLGWFGSVSAVLLGRRYGVAFVQPLLLGGVVYSVGGAMEFHGWPAVIPRVVHAHEVFHLAVLGGAFLHWLFVWQFATGEVPGHLQRSSEDPSEGGCITTPAGGRGARH